MTRTSGKRLRNLFVAMAVAVPLLVAAAPALATPKGIFKRFSDCPLSTPGLTICQYAETTGGEFSIGSTKVPINKTIVLQGGGIGTGKLNEFFLVPAADGNSLSKVELNVPGGLTGLVNCEEIKGSGIWEVIERASCKAIFENKTTGVTATTELAATTSNPPILNLANLFFETGTGLTLPVKVHLKNPLLGESCYIGSEANPVQLHLTTGTTSPPAPNKPIKGKKGTLIVEEEGESEVTKLQENSLVDNAYSAPKSEGCGGFFSFLIGPIVDGKIGLPSAAGKNTAILNGTLWSASAEAVKASE
ncbi:MAG TPA: hypothetical protein VL988_00140 [Solirubrobacteraceae bacterium]|nr:hypothetical protein [Solirubrobacteraceae bacterium]